MKIRLEKPAVNISNLTGGKNETARRGALGSTSVRFIFRLELLGVFTVSLYILNLLFNDYDVTTLKNNSSSHIPNYTKQTIKVLGNKTSCKHAIFLCNGSSHSI